MPPQLLGDWFLPPAASAAFATANADSCPSPPTVANCFIQLTLTATTYHTSSTSNSGQTDQDHGNVVVNNNEIDFFNEANREGISDCDLPGGVGRYKWTLTGGVLHFTLISEPCSGTEVLAYKGWTRTH